MIAIADDQALYLLEFIDCSRLELLKKKLNLAIVPGVNKPIKSIQNELKKYFECSLKEFKTPLVFLGSGFQKRVWGELKKISFGETRSYFEISSQIGQPTAFRAVANANRLNKFAIIIPCHRVINKNGELGGYNGGIERKKWLINHEKIGKDVLFSSKTMSLTTYNHCY